MHDRRCGAGRLHRGRETRHRGGNPGDDRSQETRADHEGAGNAHLQRRRRVHLLGFEGSVGRDLRMDDRRAGEVENLDHRRSGNQRHHRQGGQRRRGDSRQSVSVVAKNELGASKVREYFAAITVSVPIELPGYTIKKYGKRWWMTENCHEAGEDGNLGVAPDLTAFSVAGLEASHLQRLNDAKGRYYTWYEAMTGISGCTAEQCPYVQNYEGVDDVGNAFKLDGTEEGEFGVQIRGCCPEGWHVANANDWWDMLMAIKSEYAIPDDFAQGGYTFSGGHDGKPENAITKAGFYKSGCTVKNTGNVGAWLRGGNGRIVDGGIWNQANMTLTDAGEPLLQFVDGAESIGFGWYPLGYQKADGSFNSGALGKWGYVWFIGQTNASTARSLVISGTSLNLQTKTNQEAAKDIYLNVRCVKNYTK